MRDLPYLKGLGVHEPPRLYLHVQTVLVMLIMLKILKLYCYDSPILGPLGLSKMGYKNKKSDVAAKILDEAFSKINFEGPIESQLNEPLPPILYT